MQQSYLHVLSSDNNSNKNELTSFMHGYDPGHPPVIAKAYLAGERDNKKKKKKKKK